MNIIVVFPTEYLEVWLINKGSGTIFSILAGFEATKTPLTEVNARQSLVLHFTFIVSI
jgi:hypothetical protein